LERCSATPEYISGLCHAPGTITIVGLDMMVYSDVLLGQ
jgi:hypothetical protein